jgi:hypothetical protein
LDFVNQRRASPGFPRLVFFILDSIMNRTVTTLIAIFSMVTTGLSGFSIGGDKAGAAVANIISASDTQTIIEFQAPNYRVDTLEESGRTVQELFVEGASSSGAPGEPQVPRLSVLVGIPADGEVHLSILQDERKVLSEFFTILSGLKPAPIREDLSPGEWEFVHDQARSNGNEWTPVQVVQIEGEAWLRDQRIIRLSFSPFQYQPATGTLIWHQYVKVALNYPAAHTLPAVSGKRSVTTTAMDGVLRQSLINYEQAQQWRRLPELEYPNSTQAVIENDEPRFEIAIDHDGIYRITYAEFAAALASAGLNVSQVDPSTLRLLNQGEEIAIFVSNLDGNTAQFSQGEYILFYGEKFSGERMAELYQAEDDGWAVFAQQLPDGSQVPWAPKQNATMFEKYTDTNVYWLTFGGALGQRMTVQNGAPASAPLALGYREVQHEEKSTRWKTTTFTSEDTWFWDEISTSSSITRVYTTTLSAPAATIFTATLTGEIVAITTNDLISPDHHIQIYWNDPSRVLSPLVDASWDGKSRYRFEAQIPSSRISAGVNRLDLVVYKTTALTSERLYFDWFDLEYDRQHTAKNDQLTFSAGWDGLSKFSINNFSSNDLAVLDISESITTTLISNVLIQGSMSSYTIQFEQDHSASTRFWAGEVQDISAEEIHPYTAVDYSLEAEYIIIAPESFIGMAGLLANHRQSRGLSTAIYPLENIYKDFNYGIYHPIAIKNFIRYAFANWAEPPGYVVLVGDGHWNFKGYPGYDAPEIHMLPNLVWVDPWQGEVDSANLLATVVGNDPLPDVIISRIPVNSIDEFYRVIVKTITYETSGSHQWNKHILFVSDDIPDDAGDFIANSETTIRDYLNSGWIADRIYLNNYPDATSVNNALVNYLNNQGALLVNYTGHGSVNYWAVHNSSGGAVFGNTDISDLTNLSRLPVFVSMTCLDGYWIHPNLLSTSGAGPGLVEEMVRADSKGAVAAFSPTGLGVASGHDALQQGFYDSVFNHHNWDLGQASLAAKLRLYATGANYDLLHTFTVFGDPALVLKSTYFNFLPGIWR